MATITEIETPYLNGPNPVENCVKFCFEIDGFNFKGSTPASICMTFEDGQQPYQLGDKLIIAGLSVTIGSEPGQLDLTSTDSSQNGVTFESWLRSTYPFNIDTDIYSTSIPGFFFICLVWCDQGPQDNFIFDTPEGNDVLSFSQGVFNEGLPGFKFVYQLLCIGQNRFLNPKSVCPMQQRPVAVNQRGEPLPFCIDLQHELSNQVYTTVPKCDDGFIINYTMSKWMQLTYSYTQKNLETNCGVVYQPFQKSEPFIIINQAINLEDGENAASLYRLEGNLGEVKFLTSRDTSDIKVCLGDCDWLFIPAFFKSFISQPVFYRAKYRFFASGRRILASFETEQLEDGVLQIPAGPKSILSGYFPPGTQFSQSLCSYEIELRFVAAGQEVAYSEVATFRVDQNCCCDTNIFYLDPKGGYSRMGFKCVENQNFVDTGTEICLDVPCGDYESEMMSGKSMFDSEGYTTMTFVTPKLKKTEATMCELRAFKSSEKKYYIFTDKQGGETNRRVITAPGTTRIMEKDGKVTLTITVIESQNYKVISER